MLYVTLTLLGFLHLRGSPLDLRSGLFCLLLAPEVRAPLRHLAIQDRADVEAAGGLLPGWFDPAPFAVLADADVMDADGSGKSNLLWAIVGPLPSHRMARLDGRSLSCSMDVHSGSAWRSQDSDRTH